MPIYYQLRTYSRGKITISKQNKLQRNAANNAACKSCNIMHNFESVFRYFASVINSNYSTKCNRKELYAICSYSSLKKSVMFLCTPFANRHLINSNGILKSPCIAQQPDGIHPVQIHLIWIRDSPDNGSVHNKEVKFIWIYSLGPRFSVHCPY